MTIKMVTFILRKFRHDMKPALNHMHRSIGNFLSGQIMISIVKDSLITFNMLCRLTQSI